MTATIGIHCPDGIVIGAGSKRSYGTISSSTEDRMLIPSNKNAIASRLLGCFQSANTKNSTSDWDFLCSSWQEVGFRFNWQSVLPMRENQIGNEKEVGFSVNFLYREPI